MSILRKKISQTNYKGVSQDVPEYDECLEIMFTCKSVREIKQKIRNLGMTNFQGRPLSYTMFSYRCDYAFLRDPDKWRSRVREYDILCGLEPMDDDDEWNRHVVSIAVQFAVFGVQVVRDLFMSDWPRWSKYAEMWQNKKTFDNLNLPEVKYKK